MTLKVRLIALTVGALMFSLLAGGVLVYLTAAEWVQAELARSVTVARTLVHDRVVEAAEEAESADRIAELLAALAETERVRAVYVPEGAPATLPPTSAPGLLARALGARTVVVEEAVTSHGVPAGRIILATDPAAALDSVGRTIEISLSAITLVSISALVLIALGLTRSLRTLDDLGTGLSRVARGDYAARVEVQGPPDIAKLGAQFNAMSAELDEMRTRTRALTGQLLTVQEAERREIARDLHDELGPCLLAASLDLSALQRLDRSAEPQRAADCAASLASVLARMRELVRRMISRLHLDATEARALGPLVAEIAEFWRERCPSIGWHIADEAAWAIVPDRACLALSRVIREAISNAIRHSNARAISLDCGMVGDDIVITVADDGTGFAAGHVEGTGLPAMRERLAALGGTLTVNSDSSGTLVAARLPLWPGAVVR